MDRSNLQKIIEGKREIPQARRGDFRRVMEKYGYVVEDFSDHDYP